MIVYYKLVVGCTGWFVLVPVVSELASFSVFVESDVIVCEFVKVESSNARLLLAVLNSSLLLPRNFNLCLAPGTRSMILLKF